MREKTAGGQHGLISCVSPFITAWVPSTTSFQCSKKWKTRKFSSVFHHSLFLFLFLRFLCVCICEYAQHNCSISSGFIPCYPLKKKEAQNRISATIVHETHCVDSRHFSCELLKSSGRNLQCNRRRVDKSVCYENNKSTSTEKLNKQLQFQDVLQH